MLRGARLGALVATEDGSVVRRYPPATARFSYMDLETNLREINLGNQEHGFARLADIHWDGVDVTSVHWSAVVMLGDEQQARRGKTLNGKRKKKRTRLGEYQMAARTNRQLATILRAQGLSEEADRFAYRAQLCQRQVFRLQGTKKWSAYIGSLILWLVAGHGYRPFRSFITYLVIIGAFAGVYGLLAHFGLTSEQFGSWDSPLVLSVTSFHGRVFFAGGLHLDDWAARVGAMEAVFGLLIEITFIATFTQRFFSR